jgi:hypothetical protein
LRSSQAKIVCKTLSEKHPAQKRAGGMAQVVECLPSNSETLSSNPSTAKKSLFVFLNGEIYLWYWYLLGFKHRDRASRRHIYEDIYCKELVCLIVNTRQVMARPSLRGVLNSGHRLKLHPQVEFLTHQRSVSFALKAFQD